MNGLRTGTDQCDFNALRQGQLHLVRDRLHRRLHPNCIALIRTVDTDGNCRITFHEIGAIRVRSGNNNTCHIPNPQFRSIRIGSHSDIFDFIRRAFGNTCAHPRGTTRHIACGVCFGLLANRVGNFGQGNIILDQACFADFNRNFRRRNTANGHTGDTVQK